MAIKKFSYNFQVSPFTLIEDWTYVQPEASVTGAIVYSIDLLEIDHSNNRIVGFSSARDSTSKELVDQASMLLHIIYTGDQTKKVYTIQFFNVFSGKFFIRKISFNANENMMYLATVLGRNYFWVFKFPNTFQINSQNSNYLDVSDPVSGGTDSTITLASSLQTIGWTGN